MSLLEVTAVYKAFGGLMALADISLAVENGEIRGVIGPNGAGKSTLFNVISGMLRPTKGRIVFRDRDVTHQTMSRTAAHGLVRTFQANVLCENLTVLENVLIGCHLHASLGLRHPLAALVEMRSMQGKTANRANEVLALAGLEAHRLDLVSSLPHGPRRKLGIAIALAAEPTLLMLDEPIGGLSAHEASGVIDLIRGLRDKGITIMLVEHNMKAVMSCCDRISVINEGRLIAEGTPKEIARDNTVIQAYLGASSHAS